MTPAEAYANLLLSVHATKLAARSGETVWELLGVLELNVCALREACGIDERDVSVALNAVAEKYKDELADARRGPQVVELWGALKRSGMRELVCVECKRPFLTRESPGIVTDAYPLCPPCR